MPITANDVRVLHEYAEGVMNRADHHAGQVKGIALALLGGISGAAIPARSRSGNMQAVLPTCCG
jgi:hypothetical protein